MDLFMLVVVVFVCGILFYRVNKIAGFLFIPYFIWVTFAMILNVMIYKLN